MKLLPPSAFLKSMKKLLGPYLLTQSGPYFFYLPGDGAASLPSLPFQFLGKVAHVYAYIMKILLPSDWYTFILIGILRETENTFPYLKLTTILQLDMDI